MLTHLKYLSPEAPIAGLDKYLGGEATQLQDRVICVPGSAEQVLQIDLLVRERVQKVGPKYPGKFKWLRGVHVPHTKTVYGIPSCHDHILKVAYHTNPAIESECSLISLPDRVDRIQKWKYHGAVYDNERERIILIPCNAEYIVEIRLSRGENGEDCEQVRTMGPPLKGKQKWYGGLLAGSNGTIFGIPNCSDDILVIKGEVVSLIGQSIIPQGMPYKWHGACVLGSQIVGFPSHIDKVLIIDADTHEVKMLEGTGGKISNGKWRDNDKYKYGGGVASDKAVYCFPSDADQVLKIDLHSQQVVKIGPEFSMHNKWQNGYRFGAFIYAIPCNADSVLRIDTRTDSVTTIPLPNNQESSVKPKGFDKWEGGCVVGDRLYCMPQNTKLVLCIQHCEEEFGDDMGDYFSTA